MSKTRARIVISPADEKRILTALETLAEDRSFSVMRMRAFLYILWDGAIRGKTVLDLNMGDVVEREGDGEGDFRIRVRTQVKMRPCEGNRNRKLLFVLSPRSEEAIHDYLVVARQQGWLGKTGLRGPLFISSHNKGKGQRMSQRMPHNMWKGFLENYVDERMDYGLDDIVYTARLRFLHAVDGDYKKLAEFADLTEDVASKYRSQLKDLVAPTTRDLLAKIQRTKRK